MSNEIDLWNDIEDAENVFGQQSEEYKKAVEEFMKAYPETIWGNDVTPDEMSFVFRDLL